MTLNSTTPRLELNRPAPNFTLGRIGGGSVTRSAYRQRKHLGLLFLPGVDLPARDYLESLRDRYGEIREADGELLAIVTDPGASADGLAAALDLPFPLLLDSEQVAARRFLPDGAPLGLFIIDRYAMLRAQWALTALPLPPAQELVDWLLAIDRQCVI